jgi:ubiquinone/menaquinone biosynthesis C-methylase UbiE
MNKMKPDATLGDSDQTRWDQSFADQIAHDAYNTAPVEALIRTTAHYLRARYQPDDYSNLRFLEVGSGAAPNLIWLAEKKIHVSGIDISPKAVALAEAVFATKNLQHYLDAMVVGGADALPFPDNHFDGVLESCVFQHLEKTTRAKAFAEVVRVLKPGGLFAGHMLSEHHSTFARAKDHQLPDDKGTVFLKGDDPTAVHLENIGRTHFFAADEYTALLRGCRHIEPLPISYALPEEEARRRGFKTYTQHMWLVYAVK